MTTADKVLARGLEARRFDKDAKQPGIYTRERRGFFIGELAIQLENGQTAGEITNINMMLTLEKIENHKTCEISIDCQTYLTGWHPTGVLIVDLTFIDAQSAEVSPKIRFELPSDCWKKIPSSERKKPFPIGDFNKVAWINVDVPVGTEFAPC